MKYNLNNILIILTFLTCLISACSSLKLGKTKMTDEQYYLYLRKDTSICELPELKVKEHFYKILDTVLIAKERFINCNLDPNPYVYSIQESYQNENLIYKVEKLFSTSNLKYFYMGAFKYKDEIFVVSSDSGQNSTFYRDKSSQQIKVPFCDRIYHPKFNYTSFIQGEEICIECIKNEIITIQ